MRLVSLSSALSLALALYVGNTLWSLREMFAAPGCARGERCLRSQLAASPRPRRHLALFASARVRPPPGRAARLHAERDFDYTRPQAFDIELEIPPATRNNGTLFMHITLVGEDKLHKSFEELQQSEPMETIPLITFTEPRAATFNLLNSKDESEAKKDKVRPVAHINPQIEFSIFTDDIKLPANRIPEELYPYLRVSGGKFLPIIQHNILKTRLKNLQQIDEHSRSVNVTVSYAPISFGLMRLNLHMHHTITHLKAMGFGEKDIDDVKGIFADTNLYLLSATVVIASCHLLFDFLAFKNDVSFWRSKKSMAGLSTRTVLWRAFSQCVILLYLFDENTSMIVLGPASVSAIIELWKAKKVLRISVEWRGWSRLPRVGFTEEQNSAEQRTRAVDAEAMRYLSYLLYPLCFAGAVYSLLYEPHKSWYSWCLNSTVNGVYAFGFLFMLPQLFVNYRLRSVAALPWRAFMYKAFNTFIDDIFAFVITMPTAHRVACFRDDIVFLIYLYQRWLYPVDKTRTDDSVSMDEPSEEPAEEPVKLKED